MTRCPECNHRLYSYKDGQWLERVCWYCGHYESNTPAFRSAPYLFRDLVRDNPIHFMKKYPRKSDGFLQGDKKDKSDTDFTEPAIKIYIIHNSVISFNDKQRAQHGL